MFSFWEDIYLFVIIGDWLIKNKPFGAVIHLLHYFFLSANYIIRFLFIDMTLKMIFVIRLPRFRTHIAKWLTARTSHKVTPHGSFHCLFTPRTYLRVLCDPFSISFFLHYLLHPLDFLLAFTWVMIITLAAETKYFAACTAYCIKFHVYLYTISTINACAELIVLISCYELLTNFLLVFIEPNLTFLSI